MQQNEIIEFNRTEVAIPELQARYMSLTIAGIDDKEGAQRVNEARKHMRSLRIDIDDKRKELNEEALKHQRSVNAEAKRITELLHPIETHLEQEETNIKIEIARLKKEKEDAEELRYQQRMAQLFALGFKVEPGKFITDYLDTFNNERISIAVLHLKQWDDEAFVKFVDNAKDYYDFYQKDLIDKMQREKEAEAKAAEERKIEAAKLEQQRRELELERERLADIAREQTEREEKIKSFVPAIEIKLTDGINEAGHAVKLIPGDIISAPSNMNESTKEPIEKFRVNVPAETDPGKELRYAMLDGVHESGFERGYTAALITIYRLGQRMTLEELLITTKEEIDIREKQGLK